MREVVVVVLLVLGVGCSLTSGLGLVRLPDVYTRVHAATLGGVLGSVPVLVALVVAAGPISRYGGTALIACVLLFVFAPLSAHALLRATYRGGVPLWPGAVADRVRSRGRSGDEDDSRGSPDPDAGPGDSRDQHPDRE